MSPFTIVLFCIQAYFIQNVRGLANIGALGYGCDAAYAGRYGLGAGLGSACGYRTALNSPYGYEAGIIDGYKPYGCSYGMGYGGAGIGNVAVAGELPVGGATAVAGQVPIIGAVEYKGFVPAAGGVTIAGSCACGCGGPYMY